MRKALVLAWVSLLLPACGARTTLSTPPPSDAGPRQDGGRDGGFDGGLDAGFDGGPGMLIVECGRSEQFTTPRRPITVRGTAESSAPLASETWELTITAPTSMPRFETGMPSNEATLTPDIVGTYLLTYTAVDRAGLEASCTVTVQSVVGPPVALCPEEMLRTQVDVPLMIVGEGFDDDEVVSLDWELLSSPPGAGASVAPRGAAVVTFLSDTLGVHRLRLTVIDIDMASDTCEVDVQVTGPPIVMCPPDRDAPTRQEVALTATASDDVGIASRRWEMITRPTSSAATLSPTDQNTTRFTPDRQGEYQARFTVTDVEGLSASCTVRVQGLPTPPEVTCPPFVETRPLASVTITASAVDDGNMVTWSWGLTDRPAGSGAGAPSPRTSSTTTFTPDIAGIYHLTVTARDEDGMTDMCVTEVRAGNVDGLRVEMFWDTPGTDMDTHLMNPTGTRWGNGSDDCYYGNCVSAGGAPVLAWGMPGPDDDPRLDIDDTTGFGPENINITEPQPGTYRVAIHDWRGDGRVNNTTVRIYCGGSTTAPRQTFGPVALRDGSGGGNDFWRVADVTITTSGCTITDLRRADGRPWIEPYERTRNMR